MDEAKPEVGAISWADLTVPDAEKVREFYSAVIGWTHTPFDMGGYSDYCMNLPSSGKTVAGICWARGVNAGLPPVWLVYITVADLDAALQRCVAMNGKALMEPKSMGEHGRYCVIQDPAGAVSALFEPRQRADG